MYVPSIVGSSALTTAPQETAMDPVPLRTLYIGAGEVAEATSTGQILPLDRVVLDNVILVELSISIVVVSGTLRRQFFYFP
ncbi:hypothetical protein Plhal710r2_c012g0053031 [Plasmopara halstedii]